MRLGIISDTHDKLATIDLALNFFTRERVDIIVHCGDWKSPKTLRYFAEHAHSAAVPVVGVLGNNDTEIAVFQDYISHAVGDFRVETGILEFEAGDKHCAVYHGHHAPTLRSIRSNTAYDFIFLGHTHKPRIEKSNHTCIINPGSTAFSIPRSKTWQPTVATVDTQTGETLLHTLSIPQ